MPRAMLGDDACDDVTRTTCATTVERVVQRDTDSIATASWRTTRWCDFGDDVT